MFIAALFTIAKLWKQPRSTTTDKWQQPRSTTTDKWLKKIQYLYTVEFYSATNKNDILSFAGKWENNI
jgi:hypothetical protein